MQSLYDTPNHRRMAAGQARSRQFDLINCSSGSDYLGAGRNADVMRGFADISLDVVLLRDGLARAGYPASLWRDSVDGYERGAVDRAIALSKRGGVWDPVEEPPQAFYTSLRGKLAAYHASHRSTWQIVSEGGCGADEAHVNIATSPSGGQVFVIPTFYYQLCRVQSENADDSRSCPKWREAVDGKLTQVSGDYRYQVRWRDGSVRRGTLSFDFNDDGRTITLRKL